MHESSKAHSSSRPFFEADGRAGSARKGGNETQQTPAKESSPMSPNANPTKSAGHRTMARLKLEHERALDEYAKAMNISIGSKFAQIVAETRAETEAPRAAPTLTLTLTPNLTATPNPATPNPEPTPKPDPSPTPNQASEKLGGDLPSFDAMRKSAADAKAAREAEGLRLRKEALQAKAAEEAKAAKVRARANA